MEKNSIYECIFLGTSMRYLQDCKEGWPIKSKEKVMYVLDNIGNFLDALDNLKLFVTKRASFHLESLYKKLKEAADDDQGLSSEEALELARIMDEIRPTFDAECRGIYAFFISDKRFTIDKLTNAIDTLFAPNVFNKLSEIAIYDFQEAGYCITFDRPTAAAFHILRATEDVLRHYHKKFFRRKIGNKNWGQLTNELKNKNTGKKPDATIINHLINIKDSFRNPTQHPEKIYDMHEVQDLLGLSIEIINRMVKQ